MTILFYCFFAVANVIIFCTNKNKLCYNLPSYDFRTEKTTYNQHDT